MIHTRSSGILLHVSSLPGRFGIGDFGPSAYQFADFLAETGQRVWQVLPLVPVGLGYSPYSSPSTFAGNPLFISPDLLVRDGLLTEEDVRDVPDFGQDRVDYARVIEYKYAILERAFERFVSSASAELVADYELFVEQNMEWLDEYTLFMALKDAHGDSNWTEWPDELVRRDPEALIRARATHARRVDFHRFMQYVFERQWQSLKDYCNKRSIQIFGDLPIYVAHDSADVWSNQHLFFLDDRGNPEVVAGVPPDYFSETGQRWGNPIYRWNVMRENGFAWWVRRFSRLFQQVDLLRLDHFRAFEAYWEIPASEETAINGRWVEGPGAELFHRVREKLGKLKIVAEDLGIITPGVRDLMRQFEFPGMAVLQFAFDGDVDSDYLPHNFIRNLVAYTGTHDNNTTVGWWHGQNGTQDAASAARARAFARKYVQADAVEDGQVHWAFVRVMMASVANLVITPLQDILGLGSEARMNIPGSSESNWGWRFRQDAITPEIKRRLRSLTEVYGRSERRHPDQFDLS
jgi:4-alpha-glucanotransferase